MLQFTRHTKACSQNVTYSPFQLVIAGWAARDGAAVKHPRSPVDKQTRPSG